MPQIHELFFDPAKKSGHKPARPRQNSVFSGVESNTCKPGAMLDAHRDNDHLTPWEPADLWDLIRLFWPVAAILVASLIAWAVIA